MKSFQNFTYTIAEAKEKVRQKVNLSPEILPMQPEGEVASSKSSNPKKKVVKKTGTSNPTTGSKAEAIKKGYVSPEGRVQERGVVTNRIRASAFGYGDAGKDPSKYGINPQNVASEKGTLFRRAISANKPERKAARKEIKTAVKSIEKRYPGATKRTATSFRGFSRSVDSPKPSKQNISTLQRMARPGTSLKSAQSLSKTLSPKIKLPLTGVGAGKRAQAASDAAKGIKQDLDNEKAFHKRLLKAIEQLPPEKNIPTSSRTTAQKAKPGIYRVPTSRQLPAPSSKPTVAPVSKQLPTPSPATVKTPSKVSVPEKPKEVKIPKPAKPKLYKPKVSKVTSKGIEKSITSALKADREAAAAAKNIEKAAKAAKIAKGFKVATRIAAPVSAGLDAYGGYQAARGTGASKKRSIGAGIARAAGGLIGGATGGAVGSVLGPAGSVAGTVGGYGAGAELGTKVYNKLTGPVGKDFKIADLSKNIKSGLRSAGKSYTTFVSQANKSLAKYAQLVF